MTILQKIKAFRLLGKKVRIPMVESPDIIGTLEYISAKGYCRVYDGAYRNLHIDRVKAV